MREQHESEIRNLESLMKASQEMLQQQVTKYSDQMSRLGETFMASWVLSFWHVFAERNNVPLSVCTFNYVNLFT
jgi:hypothetical protein